MEMKKNPKLDYRKKSGLFFNIGLVVSLLLVISAFEWKFVSEGPVVDDFTSHMIEDDMIVQATFHPPPSKPIVRQINVIEIEEEEPEIDEIEYIIDVNEIERIPDIVVDLGEPKEEEADEIISIAETMPSFVGGLEQFYKFVGKNLKYPAQARRIGVEGKVYVHFVVDRDGSLSDIQIVRGIGAGCDEEVLRIIKKSPKWNPGKQRGNPVRVRMMMPITFKLQ